MLLGQEAAGNEWDVRWLGFSLDQTKVPEGGRSVWDDPGKGPVRLAVEVGIAVRDNWPEAFVDVHRRLFAARHDQGQDLRDPDVVAGVLSAAGLDAEEVLAVVADGKPRETFRAEHMDAVRDHQVFGVPTVIADGQAVFIRLVDRPSEDALARLTIERCVDLVTGWTNLNEFKHTSIPH